MINNKITFCATNGEMLNVWPHPKPASRFIPEEYKNTIKFPLSLNTDVYERFFELSPNKLINFSRLNGELSDLNIDFITFIQI